MASSTLDDGIALYEVPSQTPIPSGRQQDVDRDDNPRRDPYSPTLDKQGVSLNSQAHDHTHAHAHRHDSAESGHHSHVETRARHRYTIRRPRALQFSYRSQVIHAGDEHGAPAPSSRSSISSHLPEDIAKERERLDLFVDLIWVGIIGNLSEVYSSLAFRPENPDAGLAMGVFILVFLPSWRIWDAMREFLNNYYMDDVVQRAFTFWILVLSVFYGNQLAYLTEDIDGTKVWIISTYLVILGSFLTIEMIYSIFIVWLRKVVFFQWLLRGPSVGLWITAINLSGTRAIGPIVVAIAWEYMCPVLLDTRLADKFTPIEYRKALDIHHFQSRLVSFFIIILGEGVLQLVKDGPLGRRLHGTTGSMVWILLIYYEFSFLYFNRDGSQKFIPAATHRGRKSLVWVFWHVPLFASILTFAASVRFIIQHQPNAPFNSTQGVQGEEIPEDKLPDNFYRAVWTCASSLSIIMLSMTVLALLDKSLDEPDKLKVNNRYIRLSMRAVFMVVILCIPITPHLNPQLFLGLAAMMLLIVSLWEWNVSLDRGGALIEPKGLSSMLSRELKS